MFFHLQLRGYRESSVDRYLIAARSAAAQGAWSEADPYYRKVLEDFPDHAPVVYELAKVAGVLRQSARCDSLLERLQSMTDEPRIPL